MRSLEIAVTRILRPLARFLIGRGVPFARFSEWSKAAFLCSSERHFRMGEKRLTDSRLHVLTGLNRREIRMLREREAPEIPVSAGPVPRVLALWLAECSDDGSPAALPLQGDAPSFEALVAEVSRQIHPRTVLDELTRLGLAERDGDAVRLTQAAFLPARDDEMLLGYFGANLGDHAAAAGANLLAAPERGPHYERAAHCNHLTPDSVEELQRFSRKLLQEALNSVNARAVALQRRDRGKAGATHRFRAGAYTYAEDEEDPR